MKFNKIDTKTWNRAQSYNHFLSDIPCTYSMCVNIDISKLLPVLKENKLKLFPVCLYGITHIVNQHREFRMLIDEDGNLGYFDISNPCYTVFHNETETITNVWTEYSESFTTFYQNYLNDMDVYKDNPNLSKPVKCNNLFNVSCIPWTSFTGFNLNLQKGYDYLPPIFTIGKYYNDNEKILLPLAIQVHHAVCDGYHVARFVNELQEWFDNFSL